MELTGEYRIPAPREVVWRALNDPNILQRCIPGCESVEKLSDTEFTAKVVLKIGPMTAKFSGKGTLSDLNPPNGYTITGEGQGGVAGFGKGSAKVSLVAEAAAATLLQYKAETQVGGKMAQLGARLIDSTSKKLADQFFAKFAEAVTADNATAAPTSAPSPEEVPEMAGSVPTPNSGGAAAVPTTVAPGTGLKPAVWIPILIVAVAIVLWWFSRT
jgi:carbon monoxide dehydrogenase subunit G